MVNGMLPQQLNIRPSLALVKFGQGIIEVGLRVFSVVSYVQFKGPHGAELDIIDLLQVFSLGVLIPASIATNYDAQLLPILPLTAANGVRSIQFLIFLSVMSMLIEITILLVRFMNVKIINNYSTVAFAVVSEII